MKYHKHNPEPLAIQESRKQIITPHRYFKLLDFLGLGQFKNCSVLDNFFSFLKNMYSNKNQCPIHFDTKS